MQINLTYPSFWAKEKILYCYSYAGRCWKGRSLTGQTGVIFGSFARGSEDL